MVILKVAIWTGGTSTIQSKIMMPTHTLVMRMSTWVHLSMLDHQSITMFLFYVWELSGLVRSLYNCVRALLEESRCGFLQANTVKMEDAIDPVFFLYTRNPYYNKCNREQRRPTCMALAITMGAVGFRNKYHWKREADTRWHLPLTPEIGMVSSVFIGIVTWGARPV